MKNKKNIIIITIISIILTIFSSISCMIYNYAKNQVEYTIEFSQNTKIKMIGINAINIPFEKLITNPSKYLNPNIKYFIYCQKGIVSKKACQILSNYGYKVVDIIGGYEEWILQKD